MFSTQPEDVNEAASTVHLSAIISGRVQGVGFRYFVRQEARSLGLSGWVLNRPDGTVALEAEGPRVALEGLAQRLRQGPEGAVVDGVQISWSPKQGWNREFEVRR